MQAGIKVAVSLVIGATASVTFATSAEARPAPAANPCSYSHNFYCGTAAGFHYGPSGVTASRVYARDTSSKDVQKQAEFDYKPSFGYTASGTADNLVITFSKQVGQPYCYIATNVGVTVGCDYS